MNEHQFPIDGDRRKLLELPFRFLRESLNRQAPQASGSPDFSAKLDSKLVFRSREFPRRAIIKLLGFAGINAAFPSLFNLLPAQKEAHAKNLRPIEAGPRNQEELEKVRAMIAEFNKEFEGLVEVATFFNPEEQVHGPMYREQLRLPKEEQMVVFWQTLRRLKDNGFLAQAVNELPPPGMEKPLPKRVYFLSNSVDNSFPQGSFSTDYIKNDQEIVYLQLAESENPQDDNLGTDLLGIPWLTLHEFVHSAHNFLQSPEIGPRTDCPWDKWGILGYEPGSDNLADPANTLLYLVQGAVPGFGGNSRTLNSWGEFNPMGLLQERVLVPRTNPLSFIQNSDSGLPVAVKKMYELMKEYQLPAGMHDFLSTSPYYMLTTPDEMLPEMIAFAFFDGKDALLTVFETAIRKGLEDLYNSIFDFSTSGIQSDNDLFYPMYMLGESKIASEFSSQIARELEFWEVWTLEEVESYDPVAKRMIEEIVAGKTIESVVDELAQWCIRQIGDVIGKEMLGLSNHQLDEFHNNNWKIFPSYYILNMMSREDERTSTQMVPLEATLAATRYQQILSEWQTANLAQGIDLPTD